MPSVKDACQAHAWAMLDDMPGCNMQTILDIALRWESLDVGTAKIESVLVEVGFSWRWRKLRVLE